MIKKYKISLGCVLGLVFLLILFFTMYMFMVINKKITPKINDLLIFRMERMINSSVVSILDSEAFKNDLISSILKITKNSENEIISVDYDIALSSQLMTKATTKINEVVNSADSLKNLSDLFNYDFLDFRDDGVVALVPIGLAFDYTYLSQLGPKIPVKVNVMSDYYSTFESKVSSYGLNTVLIELYLKIYVTNGVLLNFEDTKSYKEYTVLVASKIVNGRIPQYYIGGMVNTSPLVHGSNK